MMSHLKMRKYLLNHYHKIIRRIKWADFISKDIEEEEETKTLWKKLSMDTGQKTFFNSERKFTSLSWKKWRKNTKFESQKKLKRFERKKELLYVITWHFIVPHNSNIVGRNSSKERSWTVVLCYRELKVITESYSLDLFIDLRRLLLQKNSTTLLINQAEQSSILMKEEAYSDWSNIFHLNWYFINLFLWIINLFW